MLVDSYLEYFCQGQLFEQGCDTCSLEGVVHNVCDRGQEYTNTITDYRGRNGVKSYYLFRVNLIILRISFSDTV